jgi:hypothetical protein
MPQSTFKLNSPTLAIREVNNQRTIVTHPGEALVTLLVGEIDAKDSLKFFTTMKL